MTKKNELGAEALREIANIIDRDWALLGTRSLVLKAIRDRADALLEEARATSPTEHLYTHAEMLAFAAGTLDKFERNTLDTWRKYRDIVRGAAEDPGDAPAERKRDAR